MQAPQEPPLSFGNRHTDPPPEHCIKQKDSITGDKCHNNIHNLSKTQARNFFVKGDEYARKIHLFCICTETGIRRLAEDDLNQN